MERTPNTSPKLANLAPPWKEGQSGNPAGRPKGQRDYATIYREALRKIAAARGVTPDEIEELIEQTGLDKALEGDYKFFQDIRDRIHGKPKQGIEHTGEGGGPLQVNIKMV